MSTHGQQISGMDKMDKLVGLCKRRGFVFASSEVYSGLAGFWDSGPLGVELKKNIERFWWDFMVRRRDNVSGLDSSCIGPEAVWKASGHVDAFNDALITFAYPSPIAAIFDVFTAWPKRCLSCPNGTY